MLPLLARVLFLCSLFLLCLPVAAKAQAKELHVAAAADLQNVMPELATAYEHATGVKVITTFGTAESLTQQLQQGDTADVFLSNDFLHPETLVGAGLTEETSPVAYARGVLVLWARKDSPAQPLSIDSLSSDKVQKIAIANDLHSPYGLGGTRAFRSLGLITMIAHKLVVTDNVVDAARLAEAGMTQVAVISLTMADSPHFREIGTFVRFPNVYPPIEQCGVVMKSAKNKATALDFLRWLTSRNVQPNLSRLGLDPVN